MGDGLESLCIGRVYGADGAVRPHKGNFINVEDTWRLDRKILKLCTYHVQDRPK